MKVGKILKDEKGECGNLWKKKVYKNNFKKMLEKKPKEFRKIKYIYMN